jgi:hypothetical protein
MTSNDCDCVIRVILDLQVRHAACKILEVGENRFSSYERISCYKW